MSTTQPNKDRNYYRQMDNRELLQLMKESTNLTELELVLAERLNKTERNTPC